MTTFDVSILRKRGLGRRIIALLQSKHPLPVEGILAGQSVASAVDELYKLSPPVYNDIDVFLTASQWTAQTGEDTAKIPRPGKNRVIAPVSFTQPLTDVMSEEYARVFLISDRTLYSVVKARTDGLINRVWVDWVNSPAGWSKSRAGRERLATSRAIDLIAGFDLNCTQIAVDIESGRLFWTAAFAKFFESRELGIVSTFTPVQSLLRYLKKRRELQVYGNDAAHIELARRLVLSNELDKAFRDERMNAFAKGRALFSERALKQARERLDRYTPATTQRLGTGVLGAPLAFGKKYAGLLNQYGDVLQPYFETIQHPKKELFLFSSKDEAPPLADRPELPRQSSTQVRRFWQLYLPPSKLTQLRRQAFAHFVQKLPSDRRWVHEGVYKVHGDAYLEGSESPSGMADLSSILTAHPELLHPVASLQIGQQIALLRLTRTKLKKAGYPEAWGILARKSPLRLARILAAPDLLDVEIERMKGDRLPVVSALPLPAEIEGVRIFELTSPYALAEEGKRMRHCVGGYASALTNRYCRIISLRDGEASADCSTVEWRIKEVPELRKTREQEFGANNPLQLFLSQNYSARNEPPTAKLYEVEGQLRNQVNAWLLEHPLEGWELLWPGRWT